MKQLGNLAIICAKRPEVLFQLYNGTACVYVGKGPNRAHMEVRWDDDDAVSGIIKELNFGKYAEKERDYHSGSERKCA